SGIVSLFAFSRAVSCLGAARASLFPALAPGVAILLGVPLTGEIPTLPQVGGVIVLSAGLSLSIRQRSARPKPPTEALARAISMAGNAITRAWRRSTPPLMGGTTGRVRVRART